MGKQLKLTEDKVLEIDPITKSDMEQFFETFKKGYSEEGLTKLEKRCEDDERGRDILSTQYFRKGQRLWLEVDVVDVNASSNLMSWLFSHSEARGNQPGLRLFGCTLNNIAWEKPTDFTEYEKRAIVTLYEKVIGQQPK